MKTIVLPFLVALCVTWTTVDAPIAWSKDAKDKKPAEKKRKLPFTVGKDTTFVDGPLDKNGYVDYEAALNERLSAGVTPENNAAVLLFKAFGPHPDGAKIPDTFFQLMKIKAPPENGDYFVDLNTYVGVDLKLKGEAANKFLEQIDRVTTRPWAAKDHPEIAVWLKKNEKPLAVVIEASKRTHYYYPLLGSRKDGKSQGLISAMIAGVQSCRGFATALSARAMLRVEEKRYDDAWQDLLACHRLGRLVGRGGTLIEGLVGLALDRVASQADVGFLDGTKLDSKQYKKCLVDLQALPPMPLMADKLNLAERFWFLETVMMIDRDGFDYLETIAGGPGNQNMLAGFFSKVFFFNIHWDSALRNSNKMYDRMYAAMTAKDPGERRKEMGLIDSELRTLKASLFDTKAITKRILAAKDVGDAKGKYVGDVMICLLVPAVQKVQHAADRAEQTQRNLHLAFALAAYKADEGRYPKKLEALAPKYLANVPNDLFNGKALIYRTMDNGYLLYSVGLNGKDDGGRSQDDDPPGDDLRVRLPLAK